MDIKESIKMAVRQLVSNKGRTILTMLGMFIGVGAVIMILALGTGFKEYTKSFYADIGLGSFDVRANDDLEDNAITTEDVEAISEIPGISFVSGGISTSGTMDVKENAYGFHAYGCSGDYMTQFDGVKLRTGRILSDRDIEISAKVAVIPDVIAKGLLKQENYEKVIGENIRLTIEDVPSSFEVIGVYKTNLADKNTADELEDYSSYKCIYIPSSTVQLLTVQGDRLDYVDGAVEDDYDIKEVMNQVRHLMNKRHHTSNNYTVSASIDMINQANQMLDMLTLFISAVAGISLLVGGVGIMNIMLVTVKERTREIGIRKALGAKNGTILRQFIIEALILTLIAGFIGMIIGYVGAVMIGVKFDLQAKCTLPMILFAVGSSTAIGLIFGVYPAYQASRMDPIEALRSE